MSKGSIIQGSHFRKIVGHGTLYMLSSFLVKGGGALLLPIYTYYLDPAEYAVYSNLMAIGAIAGIVISLYLDSAYARLFFDTNHDFRQLRRLFSTIFLFCLVWGVLAAAGIFFIIRNNTSRFLQVPWYPHVLLACVIPLVMQMNALAAVHFRSQHKSPTVIGAGVLGFVSGAAVSVILLIWLHLGAQSLLWGALASAGAIWLYYYGLLWREGLITGEFSTGYLKESLVFSLALLPLSATSWVSGRADKLLITWFGSLAESGVYSVAFEIGRAMNMFVLSLFMVYGPMIFAMLKEDAKKNVVRIEQFQAFYLHVLIGMAFFISIFSNEIFQLLVEDEYHGGVGLVPVIAFAFVFGGIRKLYATLIYYHKLTLFISLGGIMQALFSFGLNVLLIPKFGGQAAAWAKLVSMFMVAGYFYILSRKYEPLRMNWAALRTTLSILALCLGGLGLCVYVLRLTFWPLLTAKIALALVALILTWYSRFGDELRRVLLKRKVKETAFDAEVKEVADSIPPAEEE